MKDESFDLLSKMYGEFSDFRKETSQQFKQVNSRLDKIEITLEHDIKSQLQALHEGATINSSKLDEHGQRLDAIENKIDYLALSVNSQDKRLELVESKRKKAK